MFHMTTHKAIDQAINLQQRGIFNSRNTRQLLTTFFINPKDKRDMMLYIRQIMTS